MGALLLATGAGIGYSASLAAYEMLFPLSQVAEVMPSVLEAIPEERSNIENIAALGISGTSILAKEVLFRYTLYVPSPYARYRPPPSLLSHRVLIASPSMICVY